MSPLSEPAEEQQKTAQSFPVIAVRDLGQADERRILAGWQSCESTIE